MQIVQTKGPMKVKDLIEVLKKMDGERKIVVVDGNDYEYCLMEVSEVNILRWVERILLMKDWIVS